MSVDPAGPRGSVTISGVDLTDVVDALIHAAASEAHIGTPTGARFEALANQIEETA